MSDPELISSETLWVYAYLMKQSWNAVIIASAIVTGAFAVSFGLYKIAEETKFAGNCPNPWFQMGKGWQCHGERYPGVMEREKFWAEWAATPEGRDAIMFNRDCKIESNGKDRIAVSLEIAAHELCLERLARYPSGIAN